MEQGRYLYGIIEESQNKILNCSLPPNLLAKIKTSSSNAIEEIHTITYKDISCAVSKTPMRDYTLMPKETFGCLLVKHQAIIEKIMGYNLGKVKIVEAVQTFPFKLQIAKDFVANRLALIGDAAHAVHPISGQGMNLGLKDVAALAEILVKVQRLGQDIGASDVLENYQRWRRFDVALMAMTTDNLVHLFSNDIAPVRAIRDVGLGVVDRMPFVKNQLMRHAAAISPIAGKVPNLLLGRTI